MLSSSGVSRSATSVVTRLPDVVAGGHRLGELLVDAHVIDRSRVAEALLQQSSSGLRIGRLLVQQGVLDEVDLVRILAGQLGLQICDLGREVPNKDAVALLPESAAREHQVIPLQVTDGGIQIVVADPSEELRAELSRVTDRPVQMLIAPSGAIARAIDASYRALADIDSLVQAFDTTAAARGMVEAPTEDVTAAGAPVVEIVNRVITQALRDRASDIHIEPQDDRIRIRYRVDGALHDVLWLPGSVAAALVSRIKIMAAMNIVERRRPQDGQITMVIDGRPLDIRVATAATIWGENVVMRLLDKSRPLYRSADLGMPPDTHDKFMRLVRSPFGMVICAGPTGSGKTTTLYATLAEINSAERNIMTIEDPVEYVFQSINQIQINEQAGITFANGLKSILRQDPDVILVGEIRDAETGRIAVQSALTGHFVLSSLHATDTAAALQRLLDMGIESFLVASSVVAVVAQRLVRRICQSCKEPYVPNGEELTFYEESEGRPKRKFWRGAGCNFCVGTGYLDRVGVFEVMPITPEIRRLVVGWATQEELRRLAVSQGVRTLRQEAIRLVADDVTTISEVIRGVYGGA